MPPADLYKHVSTLPKIRGRANSSELMRRVKMRLVVSTVNHHFLYLSLSHKHTHTPTHTVSSAAILTLAALWAFLTWNGVEHENIKKNGVEHENIAVRH